MAYIKKVVYPPTGRVTYVAHLRKREYGPGRKVLKDTFFSRTFETEEEAQNFIKENEYSFHQRGPEDLEYVRKQEKYPKKE